MSMPDRAWYYASGGQQRGPVKTAQLKQLATEGALKPDDLVWCDGMANWSPASTVKGLFSGEGAQARNASAAATAETLPHESADSAKSASAGDHQYREQLHAAREFATQASREAAGAFKTLVADPIGGLAPCFAKLGNTRAMQVGVVFVIVAAALYALAEMMQLGSMLSAITGESAAGAKAKYFFISLAAAVAAVAAMVGVSYAFRWLARRAGSYHTDVFIVGAAAIPFPLAKFLTSLLNPGNTIAILLALTVQVFGGVASLLILFKGQTAISDLNERTAGIAVACIVAAGAVASALVMRLLG